jgi:predicted hydrocarbon binding protein
MSARRIGPCGRSLSLCKVGGPNKPGLALKRGTSMQGVIHLLLEAYVSETIGAQHLRQIRQVAGVQGPPLAAQYYPDEITIRLLQAISDYNNVTLDDALYHFGVYFINAPLLRQNYRAFLEGHTSARSLLNAVPLIHQQMSRSLKDLRLPELHCIERSPELLEITYRSPRRLCSFLQGILQGVGMYFNELLEIREIACLHQGDSACRVLVHFQPVRSTGPLPDASSLGDVGGSGPYPAGSAARVGASGQAGFQSLPPLLSAEPPIGSEIKLRREEEEDVMILYALSTRQVSTSRPLKPGERPQDTMLSLFEVAQWLKDKGASEEYSRLSLIQRSLSRLAIQGFVESNLDPHALRQSGSSSTAALGGQGILAAQRYRITPAGQVWLSDMRRRH